MSPEEFDEKCFFVSAYVQTENGVSLDPLEDQFDFGPDGLPLEWYPKISEGMTIEQRTTMAALVPNDYTGWLKAFRTRLLDF